MAYLEILYRNLELPNYWNTNGQVLLSCTRGLFAAMAETSVRDSAGWHQVPQRSHGSSPGCLAARCVLATCLPALGISVTMSLPNPFFKLYVSFGSITFSNIDALATIK